jgi:hypothetical protein
MTNKAAIEHIQGLTKFIQDKVIRHSTKNHSKILFRFFFFQVNGAKFSENSGKEYVGSCIEEQRRDTA